MPTTIAIHGATGRVGRRLIALAHADADYQLVAALVRPDHPQLGHDAGELVGIGKIDIPLTAELPVGVTPEVIIDFSEPDATPELLKLCTDRKIAVVVATTGHTQVEKDAIHSAAHDTAVLYSSNTSLVVNVLFRLAAETGTMLAGKGFDVEIIERHHRLKKDAPSGTAMHFARTIQSKMGQSRIVHGREGIVGERPDDEIGMHAVRAGDNVGEHTIIFSAPGETMELVHKGYSRDSYARGALLAAKYLAGKGAGNYTMADVLGL